MKGSTVAAIHQFVAGFSNGDAISNEARLFQRIFTGWGYESRIFCESRRILPALRRAASDFRGYTPGSDDVALLHLSIGSPVNEAFASLPCRKAIVYHNVTPAEYFDVFQPEIAAKLRRGREQVRALAGTAEVVLAVSRYNAGELAEFGYADVKVLPLLLDLDGLHRGVDRRVARRLRDGSCNVLFVGRCVPNKRLEDLLCAFYYFQQYVMPASRLIHVGSYAGIERYHYLLRTLARELGLRNVMFAGSIPQNELNAYYECADLFLCMSEHEGFCIPLLESMARGIPIVAYAAAAVPETLAGAGVLFREKRYDLIAEVMGRLVSDPVVRDAVVARERERVASYRARDLAGELRGFLQPLLDGKESPRK